MLDLINALLAVPGALLALDDITNRIIGSEHNDESKRKELNQLRSKVLALREYLEKFTEFGPEMRAWKDAHHVTNLILTECQDTFRLLDHGRSNLQQASTAKPRQLRHEINTMRRPQIGSITYLLSHNDPGIFSHVTNPNDFQSSPQWNEYIIGLEEACRNHLDKGNRDDLYETIFDLRNFIIALNNKADHKLKDGLEGLADAVIKVHKNLKAR